MERDFKKNDDSLKDKVDEELSSLQQRDIDFNQKESISPESETLHEKDDELINEFLEDKSYFWDYDRSGLMVFDDDKKTKNDKFDKPPSSFSISSSESFDFQSKTQSYHYLLKFNSFESKSSSKVDSIDKQQNISEAQDNSNASNNATSDGFVPFSLLNDERLSKLKNISKIEADKEQVDIQAEDIYLTKSEATTNEDRQSSLNVTLNHDFDDQTKDKRQSQSSNYNGSNRSNSNQIDHKPVSSFSMNAIKKISRITEINGERKASLSTGNMEDLFIESEESGFSVADFKELKNRLSALESQHEIQDARNSETRSPFTEFLFEFCKIAIVLLLYYCFYDFIH